MSKITSNLNTDVSNENVHTRGSANVSRANLPAKQGDNIILVQRSKGAYKLAHSDSRSY